MSSSKYQMKRSAYELKDRKKMEKLLTQAPVGRLGLYDGEEPYIIPLNFAYKNNRIYMHSALEGRKIEIMKQHPRVCFEVDEFLGYDSVKQFTSYRSVFCFGTIHLLDANSGPEYLEALEAINQKYDPEGKLTCKKDALVLRLDVDIMTAREKIQNQ